MSTERQPLNFVYAGLLALISILLSVVGYLSISRFDGVELTITRLVDVTSETQREVSSMRATIDSWAKQNFVPRDLFDALKDEYARRIAALEKKG